MSALERARDMIDKLQDENRMALQTLHSAQSKMKEQERKLAEKDQIIRVLQERINSGTDGTLEVIIRQKDLTIKNLEMQIQKVLKDKEDLEIQIESIKAEVCSKCQTKLMKSTRYRKPNEPFKKSNALPEKKTLQTPKRETVDKILGHKDKRIDFLTKENKRLTNLEKELTLKIYRLTKLISLSHLPPDAITECLLREIQSLESRICFSNSKDSRIENFNKDSLLSDFPSGKIASLPESKQLNACNVEDEALLDHLRKLYHDVCEFKRAFASKSEIVLANAANTYRTLENLIKDLNCIAQKILTHNVYSEDLGQTYEKSDHEFVVSCLQERLKEYLELIDKHESKISRLKLENRALKECLENTQLIQNCAFLDPKKSFFCSKDVQNINDVTELKNILRTKEEELDSVKSHLNTCQKLIEELRRTNTTSASDYSKMQYDLYTQQIQALKTKLDVAEKNIKSCGETIEKLQKIRQTLEDENTRLESELHSIKCKSISEEYGFQASAKSFQISEPLMTVSAKENKKMGEDTEKLRKLQEKRVKDYKVPNEEHHNKYEKITEKNKNEGMLKSRLDECEKEVGILLQEKLFLKSKLDASEKHITAFQKSVEILQEKLKKTEEEKKNLKTELNKITVIYNLAEKYEHDLIALRNELILKEEENKGLNESLDTLKKQALNVKYFRKQLHKELEKLHKVLAENVVSEECKQIYETSILQFAEEFLRLHDDNLKVDDYETIAYEELKHQITVYLTEIGRINELLTIKEEKRNALFREHEFSTDSHLKRGSLHHSEPHIQGGGDSGSVHDINHIRSVYPPSSKKYESEQGCVPINYMENLQEDFVKSAVPSLSSNGTSLEDLLCRERLERAKCEDELNFFQKHCKQLNDSLNRLKHHTKKLDTIIEKMRSESCNDEILKKELAAQLSWLLDEHQKMFKEVNITQTALVESNVEKARLENELKILDREVLDVKYENATIGNELRLQQKSYLPASSS